MKRLLTIALLLITATALAAGVQYYSYPDATKLHDNDRMLIHQVNSGSRNLTGSGLKSIAYQTAWDERYPKIFGTLSSSTTPINYVNAIRDRRGRVTYIQWENGWWFMGTPAWNHTYVYPFNNMTNVSRSTPIVIGNRWLTRGFVGKQVTIPGGPAIDMRALRYAGEVNGLPNFATLDDSGTNMVSDAFFWGTPSVGTLAANTTYTIRSAMAVAWDESSKTHGIGADPCTYVMANTSSAKVMTNYSTMLCRSTFRTGS